LKLSARSTIEISTLFVRDGARAADPTQMIILPIQESVQIDDLSNRDGQTWAYMMGILGQWPGFRRSHYG
jgi:hypothetical protein